MRLLPASGSVLLAFFLATLPARAGGYAVYVDRGTGSVRTIDDATGASAVLASGLRDPLGLRQLPDGNYLVTERIAFQQPGAITTLDSRTGAVLRSEPQPFPVNDALVDIDGTIYLSSASGVYRRRAAEPAFSLLSAEIGDLGEVIRLGRFLYVLNNTTGALVRIDPSQPADSNHVKVVDGLSLPIGLAAQGKDLLVAELGAGQVTRVSGLLPAQTGSKSVFAAGLPRASNIWWDGRGYWLTQQQSPGAIVKLDASGKVTAYAAGPALSSPRGILHSEPAQLLVTNFYGGSTLLAFGAASAHFTGPFASGVSERAVLGPDGDVYGADYWSGTVQRIDGRTGASKGTFARVGNPTGMAFGPDGNLYVSSYTDAAVYRIDGASGANLGALATGISYAHGLIFGPDGMIYVSASGAHHVLRLDPATGASQVFASANEVGEPLGLSFGPDGDLYVAYATDASVKRFDGQSGAYLGDFVPAGSGGIVHTHDVLFAPDGSLYAAGFFSSDVHRYDGKTGAHLGLAVPPGANGLNGATYLLLLGNSFSQPCGGAVPARSAGAASYDLTGTYELDFVCTGNCSGTWPHSMTVQQMDVASGAFSGVGHYIPDASTYWTMTGAASGAAFGFRLVYQGANAGYVIDATGTVAADGSLSGTASSSSSQTFAFTSASQCRSTQPAPAASCVGSASAPAILPTAPGTCGAAAGPANAGTCTNGACSYDGAPSLALAPGDHAIAVVATAPSGATASCTSYVRVVDQQAPVVTCPGETVVECQGALTSARPAATCSDNCSCTASCAAGSYSLGAHPVSCEARDAAGNVDACTASVTVRDTTPPVVTPAATPLVLWPPNHKLATIQLSQCVSLVSDACEGALDISAVGRIDWVTANEPLAPGEAAVTGRTTVSLAASRLGSGSGRVYTIGYSAIDQKGNAAHGTCAVSVPHDQR